MFNITAQKEAELSLQHLAYHDPLTGLPNRAMFEDHLDLAVARARRHDRSVAVLFMDLDGFKVVNDSLGHAAGDELLCIVSGRLREATRDTDLVARLGGDEFLVLLADLPDDRGGSAKDVVQAVASRVERAIGEPVSLRGRTVVTTISVGSSVFPFEALDVEDLMSRADAAMYTHKRGGTAARITG
jgi:diguanylate cyclase (GGDEF)-like protein